MFIDVHAHLNDPKLIESVKEIVEKSRQSGVEKIICSGHNMASSMLAIQLAKEFDNVYATIGLHPHSCFEFNKDFETLLKSEINNEKIVGIGEIGLDYFNLDAQIEEISKIFPNLSLTKEKVIEKQKDVFLKQLELANKYSLPFVIHMRDATGETLKLLESHKDLIKNSGLVHCYSGSLETTKRIEELGLYYSIGGSITFKNSRIMPDVLKEVGIEHVLLETDCPYLSPEPFRGQTNTPASIPIIVKKISELTSISESEIEKTTTQNAFKLFKRLR